MLWFPFAKINLGLTVLNKRSDGFHNIESLLHPIKLFDILEIIEGQTDDLTITGLPINISIEENLVWKALNIMRNHFSFPLLKMYLHKQIPTGAGLGGGSSDAAFTLLGINELFNLGISKQRLKELASEIGSDCPFFIENEAQYVKGRGELLEPFELKLKPRKLLLVIPDFTISTKLAYSKISAKKPSILPKEALLQPMENWKNSLKNDFENKLFKDFPVLSEIKKKLYRIGADYVSLTGSGSGIYALFPEENKIKMANNYTSYWMDFPAKSFSNANSL